MRFSALRLGVMLVPACLVAAGTASAAPGVPPQGTPALRDQISTMEVLLERAVIAGIRGAQAEMPDLLSSPWMFAPAAPRARGFKIDNYGVFFEVEVPGLPASITWSMEIVNRSNDAAIAREMAQLRQLIAAVTDKKMQEQLASAVSQLQQHVTGAAALSEPGPVRVVNGQVVSPAPASTPPPPSPEEVYTRQVQKALVAVMLEQGITLQIAPDDWVTVAACDSQGSGRLAPGGPDLMTLYLSIKGKDLIALRAKQITPEEAAKRIVIKNY